MKNFLCSLLVILAAAFPAVAQQYPSPLVKTLSAGDATNAAASDAFVAQSVQNGLGSVFDLSNKTITPALGQVPSNPPTASNIAAFNIYPQFWNFKGDGVSRALSTVYPSASSVATLPTMFGLPLCPHIKSLESENDACALESAA